MPPELHFIIFLVLRMAIAAAFVVSASFIAERTGPVIGGLVATLPISAGPSYVFLALDHDAAFIAQGSLSSLPVNAATIVLGLTYVVLAQRNNLLVSAGSAVAVWIVLASIIRLFDWTLTAGLAVNLVAFGICIPLLARYRHVKMPLVTRRWYDIPFRASLVATLVAIVVSTSGWVGPRVSGVIALYPIVFTSMMVILHPRIGGPPTAAVLANSAWGLLGFGLAIAVLHVAVTQFGSAIGLSCALATCIGWNLTLWWMGRRKRPMHQPRRAS
ncbi:putative membrane protein (GlpM family) [Bradyrhizobium sp. i1.3.6]